MELITTVFDWVLHLDVQLAALTSQYGAWIYLILFLIIFVETGVVVMPFLPGDSLLFVAGTLAAAGTLNPAILFIGLSMAAILGDAVNFAAGVYARRQAVNHLPFLKPEHLARTHDFFDRHGRKTIILARFVPVVRTLAPFVAALGDMAYRVFLAYNVIGAVAWVGLLIGAGFAFGNISWVKNNLTMVILAIVLLSLLPGVIGWIKERGNRRGVG